jgi:AraC-like DNA-binding protein
VAQRQLEEAARLLRTTGLRVGEVAGRVGFPDPLYFSRSFRALFSVPPSRYASEQLRP